MKDFFKHILILLFIPCLVACDFLDIVPDERPTEKDAMEDYEAARRFLYSCYSYLPNLKSYKYCLEFTADELISTVDNKPFTIFKRGNYTPSNTVISNWTTYYNGIRQCYLFLVNMGNVPNWPSEQLRLDYESQVKFLIAYYHYRLCREYGPIILLREIGDLDTPIDKFAARSPYDECVEFICNSLEEAAKGLPATRTGTEYGLVTSTAAYALIAEMRLFAASPLYNGNSEYYADFKDKEGNPLISLNYDANKYVVAKAAFEKAINFATSNGYSLYENTSYNSGNIEPLDPTQHCLRHIIIEPGNSEIIMSDSREEGLYDLHTGSLPHCSPSAFGSHGPTLTMIDRFYTKNGLPIEADPYFDMEGKMDIVTIDEAHGDIGEVGKPTMKQNLDREPRFYAWIGFQNGFYELKSDASGPYSKDESYKKYSNSKGSKLVCDFLIGGNCSRGKTVASARATDYSLSCYMNKKVVNPAYVVKSSIQMPPQSPWPLIRLAGLYLGYAEVCVETGDLDNAKKYLNMIRQRAGIPTVEESWEQIAGKALDQDLLRDIVRRERLLEFYLEGSQFWDIRRWKVADKYLAIRERGMNTLATTMEEFVQVQELPYIYKFATPKNYLMPIPQSEINKNPNLIQNIGYDSAD